MNFLFLALHILSRRCASLTRNKTPLNVVRLAYYYALSVNRIAVRRPVNRIQRAFRYPLKIVSPALNHQERM